MADDTPVVLITRPEAGALQFADMLDLPNVISPVLKLVPVGGPVEVKEGTDVILTSGAALRLGQIRLNSEQISAYCVGAATTLLAKNLGLNAQHLGDTVQDLCQALINAPPARPLLHIRGHHSTVDLSVSLKQQGLACQERIVYNQTRQFLSEEAKNLLLSGRDVIAPIFSSRSAKILSAQVSNCVGRLIVVAISEKVAEQWSGASAQSIVCAKTSDQISMQLAVKETYSALR